MTAELEGPQIVDGPKYVEDILQAGEIGRMTDMTYLPHFHTPRWTKDNELLRSPWEDSLNHSHVLDHDKGYAGLSIICIMQCSESSRTALDTQCLFSSTSRDFTHSTSVIGSFIPVLTFPGPDNTSHAPSIRPKQ